MPINSSAHSPTSLHLKTSYGTRFDKTFTSALCSTKIWAVQASDKEATVALEYGRAYFYYGGTR
jgi:hypothetical protein